MLTGLLALVAAALCYFLWARGRKETVALKAAEEAAEQQRELL
ncbi:hypothetical protein [Streptomyces sp. CT34]|nr:hypothetical protein [Streptomyces sp. CT34]